LQYKYYCNLVISSVIGIGVSYINTSHNVNSHGHVRRDRRLTATATPFMKSYTINGSQKNQTITFTIPKPKTEPNSTNTTGPNPDPNDPKVTLN